MLALGYTSGLYLAAVAMVIYVAYMVSGAWLLLVGVHQGERQHFNPAPSVNEPQ